MRRRTQDSDSQNMAFLDTISCGMGAIILLLVIVMTFQPKTIERRQQDVRGLIERLEKELFAIRGETERLSVPAAPTATPDQQRLLADLKADLTKIRGQFQAGKEAHAETAEEGALRAARLSLTEEMRALLANYKPPKDDTTVGGIPVDSEYIIFVIDTSGSMFQGPWQLVLRKISETLAVYPKVKGIQVMNDEGKYMFPSYAGKWIPDSPAIRKNIIGRLANWNPYSDSSPVEGITEAINTFYEPGRKISIYVYGDDFPRGQVEAVARYVDRLNRSDKSGQRLVRIHAVGFPTQFAGGLDRNGNRFANLMRVLTERNGGSFVALTTLN